MTAGISLLQSKAFVLKITEDSLDLQPVLPF